MNIFISILGTMIIIGLVILFMGAENEAEDIKKSRPKK